VGGLVASLLPLALGTAFGPLPIVAMIVVLLSRQPGRNGVAFLLGWIAAIVLIIVVAIAVAGSFTVKRPADPPAWVGAAHLVIGLILVVGAWLIWRGGHRAVRRMAAAEQPHEVVEAAPQLPKLLRSVPNFRPGRCALLGLALWCSIR
jgi:Sap, sulfolipid-1-addressing protein